MPLKLIRGDQKIPRHALVADPPAISKGDTVARARSYCADWLKAAVEGKKEALALSLAPFGGDCLSVAVETISEFLEENELAVYLSAPRGDSSDPRTAAVRAYVEDRCFPEFGVCVLDVLPHAPAAKSKRIAASYEADDAIAAASPVPKTLKDRLNAMDKSFAETLFSMIDAKGLSDVEAYKRANVDKKTFSKIKCNPNYRPAKRTAVSFAIALRLNPDETALLLRSAGLSLSGNTVFDVIIEYFVTTGDYKNIFDVNQVLYEFDQPTLGV